MFDSIKQSKAYQIWLKLLRVLQFLSATISLGMFSGRVYKVLKLYKRMNAASGAVEGILAAAVAYTILATILQLCLKRAGSSKIFRWALIVLDIAFVGAFIAVAVLTAPNGPSGPCRRSVIHNIQHPTQYKSANCKLPWGTFILAIFSTVLHFLTAIFHEAKDHIKNRHSKHRSKREMEEDTQAGTVNGVKEDDMLYRSQRTGMTHH